MGKTLPVIYNNSHYNFRKANFQLLYDMLCLYKWESLLNETDINIIVFLLNNYFYEIIEGCLPKLEKFYMYQIIKDKKN